MKKLNHIWIFSDSISGHEIQSKALASKIANSCQLFHCGLRQPWLSFAPRILPGFGRNIIWKKHVPDKTQAPDAIITCGRRMAAVGKYFKRMMDCKHIQILNPTDNPKKYDLIVSPEHDRLKANNVIISKGSLHSITTSSLIQYQKSYQDKFQLDDTKVICLMLGNPANAFFRNLDDLVMQIKKKYPSHQLHVCGSRRTNKKVRDKIRKSFKQAQSCWLSEVDGQNPYLFLLASSDVLLVTADSINMVSEACASDKTVTALAQKNISPKHKRFIQSMGNRLSGFGTLNSNPIPLDTLTHVAQQVVLKLSEAKNLSDLHE